MIAKKMLILLLALILVSSLFLVGCGGSSDNQELPQLEENGEENPFDEGGNNGTQSPSQSEESPDF